MEFPTFIYDQESKRSFIHWKNSDDLKSAIYWSPREGHSIVIDGNLVCIQSVKGGLNGFKMSPCLLEDFVSSNGDKYGNLKYYPTEMHPGIANIMNLNGYDFIE